MTELTFRKNQKVLVNLSLKDDGFSYSKYIKSKRIDKFFRFREFEQMIKNGQTLGFKRADLEEFLRANCKEITASTKEAKSEAKASAAWNYISLLDAKEKSDFARVAYEQNQISLKSQDY